MEHFWSSNKTLNESTLTKSASTSSLPIPISSQSRSRSESDHGPYYDSYQQGNQGKWSQQGNQDQQYKQINNMEMGNQSDDVQPLIRNLGDYYTDITHSSLISKVYMLISVQLLVTFLVVLPMYLHKHYVESHTMEFFFPSLIGVFVLLLLMFFTKGIVKLFTSLMFSGMMGMMIGSSIVRYDVDVLFQSMIITLSTTVFCSVYVHVTGVNLHHWKNILSCGLWVMLLASFIFILFPISNLVHIIWSICGIALFVGYLLYDTSELRVKYTYEDGEYITIATNIYLDIINMFLYMLDLWNRMR